MKIKENRRRRKSGSSGHMRHGKVIKTGVVVFCPGLTMLTRDVVSGMGWRLAATLQSAHIENSYM